MSLSYSHVSHLFTVLPASGRVSSSGLPTHSFFIYSIYYLAYPFVFFIFQLLSILKRGNMLIRADFHPDKISSCEGLGPGPVGEVGWAGDAGPALQLLLQRQHEIRPRRIQSQCFPFHKGSSAALVQVPCLCRGWTGCNLLCLNLPQPT